MKIVLILLSLPLLAFGKKPVVSLDSAAFNQAVATNGVAAAKKAINRLEWRDVANPVAEIESLAEKVKGRKGFEGLEKELKTKLRLLTPGAKMDGGDGTMAVPVAEAPVVDVPGVPIPHLGVSVVSPGALEILSGVLILVSPGSLDIPSGVLTLVSPGALEIPSAVRFTEAYGGIFSGVVDPPHYPIRVVDTRIDAFVSERDVWAARYGKSRRFRNEDGTEFAPDWGTGLHHMRRELDEDALRYDALIDAYNERVERMQWRKKMLKGQGVSQ